MLEPYITHICHRIYRIYNVSRCSDRNSPASETRDLVKSRRHEIGSLNNRIALKFDKHIGQHCCRCVCQISERLDNFKYESPGFETSRGLTTDVLSDIETGPQDIRTHAHSRHLAIVVCYKSYIYIIYQRSMLLYTTGRHLRGASSRRAHGPIYNPTSITKFSFGNWNRFNLQ